MTKTKNSKYVMVTCVSTHRMRYCISLEDLQARISNFIEKADDSASSITFNLNIDKSLESYLSEPYVKESELREQIGIAQQNKIKAKKNIGKSLKKVGNIYGSLGGSEKNK